MECPNCAGQNRDTARYCNHCGQQLKSASTVPLLLEAGDSASMPQLTVVDDKELMECYIDMSSSKDLDIVRRAATGLGTRDGGTHGLQHLKALKARVQKNCLKNLSLSLYRTNDTFAFMTFFLTTYTHAYLQASKNLSAGSDDLRAKTQRPSDTFTSLVPLLPSKPFQDREKGEVQDLPFVSTSSLSADRLSIEDVPIDQMILQTTELPAVQDGPPSTLNSSPFATISNSEQLVQGIVRILDSNGNIAGTGFVVSTSGLIATCSHVVQHEALQERGAVLAT